MKSKNTLAISLIVTLLFLPLAPVLASAGVTQFPDPGPLPSNIRAGDTLNLQPGQVYTGTLNIGGLLAAPDQPTTITTHGDGPRAIIRSDTSIIVINASTPTTHVVIDGIEFHGPVGSDVARKAVKVHSAVDTLVFRDCLFTGWSDAVVLQLLKPGKITNVRFDNCIFVLNYIAGETNTHSQGVFTKDVDGVEFRNCLFDTNGWRPDTEQMKLLGIPPGLPTKFNHNLYAQHGSKNIWLINCVIANGSSHGVQLRNGGTLRDNLFYGNAVHAFVYGDPDAIDRTPQILIDNVFAAPSLRKLDDGLSRGWGLDLGRTTAATVLDGNIILPSPQMVNPIVKPRDNTDPIYPDHWPTAWRDGMKIINTTRTLDGYAQSIGMADAAALFRAMRGRERGQWNVRLSASTINAWLRGDAATPPTGGTDEPIEPTPTTPYAKPPTDFVEWLRGESGHIKNSDNQHAKTNARIDRLAELLDIDPASLDTPEVPR